MSARSPGRTPLLEGQPIPPDNLVLGKNGRLEDLYRSQAPRLVRFFSRRASAQDANDLAQDAFTKLAAIETDRSPSIQRPRAYLMQIAHNLIRDRAKLRHRRSVNLHVEYDENLVPALDQQRALEARDMLQRIEQSMLRLPVKTREIFLAHRLDGFSYAQIAERTGMSVKGIEKQMSRAIAHLDRTLGPR